MGRLNIIICEKAMKKHKYLLFRDAYSHLYGANCGVINTKGYKHYRKKYNDKYLTPYYSFRPCGLMEYILHKPPFKTTTK